jgi:hypothetical protein
MKINLDNLAQDELANLYKNLAFGIVRKAFTSNLHSDEELAEVNEMFHTAGYTGDFIRKNSLECIEEAAYWLEGYEEAEE